MKLIFLAESSLQRDDRWTDIFLLIEPLEPVLVAAQTPEGEQPKKKGFKDYEPGYFHMDIKYLPRMPDEESRSYLFVAIDRATRWVFIHIYPNQTEDSRVDFLSRLERASPVRIRKLLTDNGSQFTDRFASAAELASTLQNYLKLYNQHIPQRALEHIAPVDAMTEWCKKSPELFKKKVYKQADLDI